MLKKFKTKKYLLGIIFVVILITLIFFTLFFSNKKSTKLKGSILDVINYSEDFTDPGFYACVVNAYNIENNTDYGIDYKLSDDELASIRTLTCNTSGDKYKYDMSKEKITGYAHPTGFEEEIQYYKDSKFLPYTDEFYTDYYFANYKVESVDGIDKLTGLESFTSYVSSATKIDLSKNPNLKYLDLHVTSSVAEINLSNNSKLTNLLIDMYQSTKIIGLENLVNLTELYIYEETVNNLTSYNYYEELSNLLKLEKLTLRNTKFYEMGIIKDLENLKELSLYVSYNEKSVTTLSELKSLLNLKALYYGGPYQLLGDLPEVFPNLEVLNLKGMYSNYMYPYDFSSHIIDLDLSRFKNVKRLYIPTDRWFDDWGDGWTLYKNTSILNNFDKLVNLEYLNANYSIFDNISSMTKLKTLVTTATSSISNEQSSIETIYGSLTDYGSVPNLKNLYNSKIQTSTRNLSVIGNLYELYLESSNYDMVSSITEFNNLKEFYYPPVSSFDISHLYNSKNLIKLFVDRGYINTENNNDEIDFSNNTSLDTIVLYSGNFYAPYYYIIGIDKLTELKHCTSCRIKSEQTLSENIELEYLDLVGNGNEYATFTFGKNEKLKYLNLNNVDYYKIDLSNNKNLEYLNLSLSTNKYDGLDASMLNNLKSFDIDINDYSMGLILNKKTNIFNKYLFPSQYKIVIKDNEYVEYKDGYLYGKQLGDTRISVNAYNTKPAATRFLTSNTYGQPSYSIDIHIQYMASKNQIINNEEGYIFTNGFVKEKNIINDLYFLPSETMGDLYGIVDRNNYKIFNYKAYSDQYKLIKVTSDLYKVEADTIKYYGDFNIDRVRVTNAEKELVDNKLVIKYNNKIVKEYNLIQDYSLKGDVNSDGEITISDLIQQYKHVNYLLDLSDNDLYRADINSDDDVETIDVDLLYDIVKKGN